MCVYHWPPDRSTDWPTNLLKNWLMGQCLLTCLPKCLPTYLPTCLHTYLTVCLPACLPACMPTCLPSCLPVCLPTYYLPTYYPTTYYLPTYLPTHWLSYLVLCYFPHKYDISSCGCHDRSWGHMYSSQTNWNHSTSISLDDLDLLLLILWSRRVSEKLAYPCLNLSLPLSHSLSLWKLDLL